MLKVAQKGYTNYEYETFVEKLSTKFVVEMKSLGTMTVNTFAMCVKNAIMEFCEDIDLDFYKMLEYIKDNLPTEAYK